tara:strand:- start:420 stop:1364 length:945 start_codon:yes stop_codon:yes gene_type:complete
MESISKEIVSVIICTYNQESVISKCIESVLNQKVNFKLEIIIVDDCSQDNTSDICISYQKKKPDIIKYFGRKKNVGVFANVNKCYLSCNGNYIANCAGDDYYIDEYKLQKQYDLFKANPDYGLVYTDYKILDVSTNKLRSGNAEFYDNYVLDELLIRNFIPSPTMMIKAELVHGFINNNEYYSKLSCEDYQLCLFIAQKNKIGFVKDETCVYRQNLNSNGQFTDIGLSNNFVDNIIQVQIIYAKKNNLLKIIRSNTNRYYNFMIYESINKRTTFNINQGFINLIKIRSLNFHYIKYYLYHFFAIKYFYNRLKNE